jgi:hypothetical protein
VDEATWEEVTVAEEIYIHFTSVYGLVLVEKWGQLYHHF